MMRRDTWNTYAIYGYTDVGINDQRSAGGVHCHQVRKTKAGWQERILQSNGSYEAAGPVKAISDADGEAKYATAEQR